MKPQTLKAFDIEAAKAGAPVVTRNGSAARILAFDLDNPEYSLAVAVTDENIGQEFLSDYTERGSYYAGDEGESGYDLFMAPVKKTGWFNLFHCGVGGKDRVSTDGPWPYATEEEAKAGLRPQTMHNYIGTFPFHYEE